MRPGGTFAALQRWFGTQPFGRKLNLTLVVTIGTALLLAGLGVITADAILFLRGLSSDLSTFATIVADNSTASLAFNDPNSAGETLQALRARTHVVAACLYRANGTVLASYVRESAPRTCPAPGAAEVQYVGKDLQVTRPIVLRGQRLGNLVLQYDLDEIRERVSVYGLTVLLVMLLASGLAFAVSRELGRLITGPILLLAQTTAKVTTSRNYGIRAQQITKDEVGDLVQAFNEMLSAIQARDEEVQRALVVKEEAAQRLSELNADLRNTNQKLARSNEDLERFAFVASHDLQEPLRMISIYSQLLVRDYKANPGSEGYVEHVVNGVARMRQLLADLLAYAELASPTEHSLEATDLNLVLETVQQNLKAAIEESGTRIDAETLPSVRAAEGHLIPLFQNLIGNAIKYRSAEAPHIRIGVARVNGDLTFSIADNGLGINSEYHEKIFMAFKRLHTNKIPGTGIGLAICQRIVAKYGGRIWVESELGQGATFKFTLPNAEYNGRTQIQHTSH